MKIRMITCLSALVLSACSTTGPAPLILPDGSKRFAVNLPEQLVELKPNSGFESILAQTNISAAAKPIETEKEVEKSTAAVVPTTDTSPSEKTAPLSNPYIFDAEPNEKVSEALKKWLALQDYRLLWHAVSPGEGKIRDFILTDGAHIDGSFDDVLTQLLAGKGVRVIHSRKDKVIAVENLTTELMNGEVK